LGSEKDFEEIKEHEFFRNVDWGNLRKKNVKPPFKPIVTSPDDLSNIETTFYADSIIESSSEDTVADDKKDRYDDFSFARSICKENDE